MKIYIDGANGYIGRQLALRLANDGHTIHALCRDKSKAQTIKHANIITFLGDLSDKQAIMKAMKNCQQAYHIAGYANFFADNNDIYYDTNVLGSDNTINAAIDSGISRIVLTSSCGVFGRSRKDIKINEQSPFPIKELTAYEKSKITMEKHVLKYAKDIDIIIVYPTRVYGGNYPATNNWLLKLIYSYCHKKLRLLPNIKHNIANYVYIDDVVSGHILAMNNASNYDRFILGGENISFASILLSLAENTGIDYQHFYFPLSILSLITPIENLYARLKHKPALLTAGLHNRLKYNYIVSSEKACSILGYEITSFNEGLNQTFEVLKTNVE